MKHVTLARLVSIQSPRHPYQRGPTTAELRLELLDGGSASIVLPLTACRNPAELIDAKCEVTFAFLIPTKVETLDTLLNTKGALAALEYARKELAK